MNVAVKRLPLQRFLYGSRSEQDELAYRNHYLANDVRQIKSVSYGSMGFMIALTLQDLPNLGENPDLMTGVVLRILLTLAGLVILWSMRPDQSHHSVDLKVIIFSCLTAAVLVSVHFMPSITPVRMVGVATLFIMAVHIGYPCYSATLLPAITIVIGGEMMILFDNDRPQLADSRILIPTIIVFAEYMAVIGSAYYYRTRYQAYKAIAEVETLSGMLPICASCKKVRDDQGYYQQIENYISARSTVEFTHSICPKCIEDLYPEMDIPADELIGSE
ncbi:MAG: hypothetical protein P8M72_01000 [Gammaproteobacteria bacterium]|nr:hypothetical protein [Gammaproteobacteria bacterium]